MLATALKRESDTAPTVLVVEEQFMIRMVLCDYLQECGFKVLMAKDAAGAIEIINRNDVDLRAVLSDKDVPGLANWLRANRPDLRLLLASGDDEKAKSAKELCEGEKLAENPYDVKTIVARVRAIIDTIKLR
ncbi:MAG TPA: hypothetical protein VKV77_03530 [Methylovirgula sp.]|nr:hypothetical protein [Methylovirgula sp.]